MAREMVENKMTCEKAEESFHAGLKFSRLMDNHLKSGGPARAAKDAELLGRNILHEEIGLFGEWDGALYGFDDETLGRLIAHGRQDAAATLAMVAYACEEAHAARRLAARNLWVSVAVLLIVLASTVGGLFK